MDEMGWFKRLSIIALVGLGLIGSQVGSVEAATYYVCFASGTGACTSTGTCTSMGIGNCSDACAGTQQVGGFSSTSNGPWCSLPGSRNTADTGWLHTTWGSIANGNRITAGDTIWIKGGTTYTNATGGRIHVGLVSGVSYYAAGTAGNTKSIRNGVGLGTPWGSGDVTFNCSGMTIDSNPGYGCLNFIGNNTEVNYTEVLGASDSARIRIINSTDRAINVTKYGGSPDITNLAIQYFEAASSASYGVNVDSCTNCSLLNGITHNNLDNGVVFGGYGNSPCTNCSAVDIESYSNGSGTNNEHGFGVTNSGTLAAPVLFLRDTAHNNIRDGFDIGLVTTTGTTVVLGVGLQSYSNAEDGFACSGDPACSGCSTTCSVINSIFWNNGQDSNCLYENGGIYYVTNTVAAGNGTDGGGAAAGCFALSGGVTVDVRNSICYRPATSKVAWGSCGGASGAPTRRSRNSIYIPRTADTDLVIGGTNYDSNPSGSFAVWTGNLLGISSPNYDSPPLFRATSDTTYSSNDYYPSAANTAAIDAGSAYCAVTSATGSGTSFTVNCDPRLYFYVSTNRPGVPADTAYIGIGTATCTVASLTANSVTCTTSVSWSVNDSVLRTRQIGSAPDMGTYEFGSSGLVGDLDANGVVDIFDLQHLVNVLLGAEPSNPRADLDGDGSATILDLQRLVNVLLGV